MQNPSAFIHSHDVITLPDEAEGWWLLTVSMGEVTPPTVYVPFHIIVTAYSGWPCVSNDCLCYSPLNNQGTYWLMLMYLKGHQPIIILFPDKGWNTNFSSLSCVPETNWWNNRVLAHREFCCCWSVNVWCRVRHHRYLCGMIWMSRLCSTDPSRQCQRMQCIMGAGNTGNYTTCTASTRWASSLNLIWYNSDTRSDYNSCKWLFLFSHSTWPQRRVW